MNNNKAHLNTHTSLDFGRSPTNNTSLPIPKIPSTDQPPKLKQSTSQTALNTLATNNGQQQSAIMTKKRMQAERAAYRQRMRNELARKQDIIRKEKEFNEKTKIWKEQVIPYWNEMAFSHKVKDLCFKGIPPRIREKVWPLLIGNELHINELMYDKLLQIVQELFGAVMTAAKPPDQQEENTCPSTYILDNAYIVVPTSYGSEVGAEDIPIPKRSISIDVTEESWFENERDGSLDQDTFAAMQKQLFNHPPSNGIPLTIESKRNMSIANHVQPPIINVANSVPNSPPVIPHIACSIDSLIFSPQSPKGAVFAMDDDDDDPIPFSTIDIPSYKQRNQTSPSSSKPILIPGAYEKGDDGTQTAASSLGLSISIEQADSELPFPSSSVGNIDSCNFPDSTLKSFPKLSYSNDPILSLIHDSTISQGIPKGLQTPPPRFRHSTEYLKQVGLLQEGTGATPLTKNHAEHVAKEFGHSVLNPNKKSFISDELEEMTMDDQYVPDPMIEKLILKISSIQYDIPRTFPTYAFYHDHGAMHIGLERVLLCYALYNPAIGYLQGMSFLVATLLLCMDEFETFKCLANLLSRRLLYDFYTVNHISIDNYIRCFDEYFKKLLPLLYNHFQEENVSSRMFLMDWIITLFTKALPLEIATQVWDAYLFEGESYLLCVGLGILKMFAHILSKFTLEKIPSFLMHLPADIKADELFSCVSQINISKKQYEKIRQKIMKESQAQDPLIKKNNSSGKITILGSYQRPQSTRHASLESLPSHRESPSRTIAVYPNYLLSQQSLKSLKQHLLIHTHQNPYTSSFGNKLSPSRSTSHLPDYSQTSTNHSNQRRTNSHGTPPSNGFYIANVKVRASFSNSGDNIPITSNYTTPERKSYQLSGERTNSSDRKNRSSNGHVHNQLQHSETNTPVSPQTQDDNLRGATHSNQRTQRSYSEEQKLIAATSSSKSSQRRPSLRKKYDYCTPS